MLDDAELTNLLSDLESDRVERKESIADVKRIRQAICAFANDMPGHGRPGVVFVGVRDDGSCAHLPITDRLLLTLSNMRSDGNILPLPAWIRVGPRRAIASEEEEYRLVERRQSRHLPWDLQPLPTAEIIDLDLDLFERMYLPVAVAADVLAQNNRSVIQRLMSFRFVTAQQSTPTVVGVLTIGKSPTDFIPGAYVQFLRISGTKLIDPITDQRECHGPLYAIVRQVDDLLQANIRIATDITSADVEVRKPEYPIVALQQLVRNAIMHRDYGNSNAPTRITWYDDRIEIHKPGGPFGQVTTTNFGQPGITDYRNPNVAESMRNLGFVQRFGVGIAIARQHLADNGNPPPEFTVEANYILATVRRQA